MSIHVTAIIAAAGRGQRFGGPHSKQFVEVRGRAVLDRSVSTFLAHPGVDEVIVVLPPDLVASPPSYLRSALKPLQLVEGGVRRQDSVMNALKMVSAESDVIVVHDAARPFASADLIARTISAASESGAAVAAVTARDTVKRSASDDESRLVEETLPRDSIYLAQTPQAFRRDVLRDILKLGTEEVTDEAAWAERAGHVVRIVEGEPLNIKITAAEDLMFAEAIARERDGGAESAAKAGETRAEPGGGTAVRVGTGYDLHKLVEGRLLILGGVTIPFERGLLGHSDADAVCHAIIDALLGAAGAGDIGRHFPDSDPRWRGASSLSLLRRAAALVAGRGFLVLNTDVVVIAERPKMTLYVDAMRAAIASALGVSVDRVSIKGKSNDGVGAIGRGEAIAAHAVVLLAQKQG
jgi:2-C-methyl-D-erythritol 4-phosphate cytidylyltransferase/2-C-methyl-D-erythritol 2,4-cyclodiphosphate synthase